MKRSITTTLLALTALTAMSATTITVTVSNNRYQTVTGFGAASCDGAMKPYGTDTKPAQLLYGKESPIGLNIMRMEISPSFEGDGWGDYDWNGSLPSAKIVKQRGGIVFGTPWSPPGSYKTNGVAQGGKTDDPATQKEGKLRKDCYSKFFPWLNTFMKWMRQKGVTMDAVSIQNEPDWWVNYSGCLYTPEEQLELVKGYADKLDRAGNNGVRLISAEPLGFDPKYSDMLMDDTVARKHIDIVAGHLYGHPPLGNMRLAAQKASKYGKEVWMTEHSVTDNIGHLPTWHENLLFAEELNECMLAGCTGYIYWYMRAHWAFVGTGEAWDYQVNGTKKTANSADNKKNQLLPRAYVISHFAKNVTGSTRLGTSVSGIKTGTESPFEASAYIKGDSLIVMAIDTTKTEYNLKLKLPMNVKSGKRIISTGNEKENMCQEEAVEIAASTKELTVTLPPRSLNTFIFQIDGGSTAIEECTEKKVEQGPRTYYNIQGRRLQTPKGLCIERSADGSSRKVFIF